MAIEEFEDNIKKAFQSVKRDIIDLKDQLRKLNEKQTQLETSLASLQAKIEQEVKAVESTSPFTLQESPLTTHTEDLVQLKLGGEEKEEKKKSKARKVGKKAVRKKSARE